MPAPEGSTVLVRFLERLNSPVVFAVAVAVFLILDGFLLYRYQQSLQSTTGSASSVPVEVTSSSPKVETTPAEETTSSPKARSTKARSTLPEETTSSPKEAGGVRVSVKVAGIGVGLSILEDGQLVYDQVADPGFSEEFDAEQNLTVTAADAGLVQVGVNDGNPRPLGTSGEQVTRTFTPED
jgi:cytoskeleton protein RodZ